MTIKYLKESDNKVADALSHNSLQLYKEIVDEILERVKCSLVPKEPTV